MDYIYKDVENNKHVGSLENVEIIPLYSFQIQIKKSRLHCILNHLGNEWVLEITTINQKVELADPTDIIWNSEALYEVFNDINISMQAAYGIKHIYEINPIIKDVLF